MATPLTDFETIRKRAKELYGENCNRLNAAPWVRDAYIAENVARKKKHLPALHWQSFIDKLTDPKLRDTMLVAKKLMDAALKELMR